MAKKCCNTLSYIALPFRGYNTRHWSGIYGLCTGRVRYSKGSLRVKQSWVKKVAATTREKPRTTSTKPSPRPWSRTTRTFRTPPGSGLKGTRIKPTRTTGCTKPRTSKCTEYTIPHAGQTDQIDHHLHHPDPNLPSWDVVQDLYSTDATQETCARSYRLYAPTQQHELDYTDHTDHTDQNLSAVKNLHVKYVGVHNRKHTAPLTCSEAAAIGARGTRGLPVFIPPLWLPPPPSAGTPLPPPTFKPSPSVNVDPTAGAVVTVPCC